MANLFGTLNISKKGMMAQSFAINTTSHNISNADTPGFSRQRVHMQASSPYTYSGIGHLGTGVDVVGIERIRDEFLDAQICYEVSINGRYEASQTVLEQVEMIFLEPSDTGLNEYMTAMWDSWEELGNYPEKSNGSTFVAGTSKTFADELNRMSLQLDTLKLDTISTIEGKTYDANQLIHEIQDLSDQIYKLSTKDLSANDLMDRRDLMIEKLSAIVNVNVDYDEFSRVKITEADSGSNIVLLGFNTQEPVTNEMSTIRSVTDLGVNVQE
ncbi:MAG: flagellar hook-associated protein FlgK, partial [Clostridia bacterium]|nr:flagellar hook-associated protein FlgK [Clostridia bacterium]